jgi:hypothetical protein
MNSFAPSTFKPNLARQGAAVYLNHILFRHNPRFTLMLNQKNPTKKNPAAIYFKRFAAKLSAYSKRSKGPWSAPCSFEPEQNGNASTQLASVSYLCLGKTNVSSIRDWRMIPANPEYRLKPNISSETGILRKATSVI